MRWHQVVISTATAVTIPVVLIGSNFPFHLWLLQGTVATVTAVLVAAACLSHAIFPNQPQLLVLAAGLATTLWGLRAIDLLIQSVDNRQAWSTLAATVLILVLTAASYAMAALQHDG